MDFKLLIYLSQADPIVQFLDNNYIVGRDKTCGIRILSNIVSSEHCTLILMPKTKFDKNHYYVIKDGIFGGIPSRNGTWINGRRIQEIVRLNHQDVITFGQIYPKAVFIESEVENEQNNNGTFGAEIR